MLIIQNGVLVSGKKAWRGDLALEGDKITAVAPRLDPRPGDEVKDAAGCLVFPGFIDPHTHLDMESGGIVTADDFPSGTLAAACGGTTTLVDFATQDKGMTLGEALSLWHGKADGKSSCNYAFHMALTDWNETTRRELKDMVAAGVTSLKVYLAYDALRVDDGALFDILTQCRKLGLQIGCHCENGDLVNVLRQRELDLGHTGPAAHPASRPAEVEAEAISRYCYVARLAGCPVTVVHLSSAAGLAEVRKARSRGQTVYVETCPQYLLLDESRYHLAGFQGAKFVMSPPLRPRSDGAALRQALLNGEVDTLATDHCSYRFSDQKTLGRKDFTQIPNGAPGLEHRPALFFTAFVHSGLTGCETMCALLAENPAKQYGLWPRKGRLAVGADADVVVWDPAVPWTISAENQHHRVDYTPYEGFRATGRARWVYVNGQLAAQDGQPVREGLGRYVPRSTR